MPPVVSPLHFLLVRTVPQESVVAIDHGSNARLSLVALFITGCVSIPTGTAQAAWFKASEERVSATTKLLGSIKWIKISGLNDMAFNMVQKLRTHELQVSKKFRVLLGITLVLCTCTYP